MRSWRACWNRARRGRNCACRRCSKLRSAGICVGVNPNPIMPGITDSEDALDARGARGARCAARCPSAAARCSCRGAAQKVFLPFLEREFPHLAARYRETFENSIHLSRAYKDALGERVRRIRERYGLASGVDRVPARVVGRRGAARPLSATVKAGCNLPISITTCPRN